jgi:LPXTG-motif cell wall-anchored protein
VARSNQVPAAAGGGNAPASADALPYTGAESWIAAGLGVLLLALGIVVHVKAVRIGMTAMLYRRGILLRPVDCARLARSGGTGALRAWISVQLSRLLEEPEDEFACVGTRFA